MNAQGSKTPPVRTCVGCRSRDHLGNLLRVVLVEAGLMPDPRRELSGRGAYVHPTRECVDAAVARRAFGRALRAGGPLDTKDLVERWGPMLKPKLGASG